MIRLTNAHGYDTSRDYDLLVELMQKTGVICFIDYNWSDGGVTRDVAATVYRNGCFDISCRGTSYAYSFDREMFILCCHKYNVEFIVPVRT
jgi:hypothetical protein